MHKDGFFIHLDSCPAVANRAANPKRFIWCAIHRNSSNLKMALRKTSGSIIYLHKSRADVFGNKMTIPIMHAQQAPIPIAAIENAPVNVEITDAAIMQGVSVRIIRKG